MVIVYVVVVNSCSSPLWCVCIWCGVVCYLYCVVLSVLCVCVVVFVCGSSVPLLLHFQGNNVKALEMAVIEDDSNRDSNTNGMVMLEPEWP